MVAVCCKGIEVACCKSAKTSVAKACIRLLLVHAVDGDAKVLEHCDGLVLHTQVIEARFERASHKELNRKIVDLLFAL